jgi:hypothetical protein
MDTLLTEYVNDVHKCFTENNNYEFEIIFNNDNTITKQDTVTIIDQLYKKGYVCLHPEGIQLLRIHPMMDKTVFTKGKNIRLDIIGSHYIQVYCEESENIKNIITIPNIPSNAYTFTHKCVIGSHHMNDFGYRVKYKHESFFPIHDTDHCELINQWTMIPKTYRMLQRMTFIHPTDPIIIDISTVKTSRRRKGEFEYVHELSIGTSGIFTNEEEYEIEIELDTSRIHKTPMTVENIKKILRVHIYFILSELQATNHPIRLSIINNIKQSYKDLIQSSTLFFHGPSSVTLSMKNLRKSSNNNMVSILQNYCVTDKADGLRMLMYISSIGDIFFIDTNMKIIHSGIQCDNKMLCNSLLDGEYMRKKTNNNNNNIIIFAAFDIYYNQSTYYGTLPFIDESTIKTRLHILQQMIHMINQYNTFEYQIICKQFEYVKSNQTIFEASAIVLDIVNNNNNSSYMNDGLIYTPMNKSVGSKDTFNKHCTTWFDSFKWKPIQYTTIDFLVRTQKDEKGNDKIYHNKSYNIEYKVIELMCGYLSHNVMNPLYHVTMNKIIEQDNEYKPHTFHPTQPLDPYAYLCNIIYSNGHLQTENGEFFDNNMIVEFRYDVEYEGYTNENAWKWIPIRVRHDKTTEMKKGILHKLQKKPYKLQFGNSFQVANDNWKSIHNPITYSMIRTGNHIIPFDETEDVYYASTDKNTNTQALRNFHNRYVKRKLITGIAHLLNDTEKKTLIDLSVGKAGDLYKWKDAKLDFVLGIDINDDNIQNSKNGACIRYLQDYVENQKLRVMFAIGNTSKNIRDNTAFLSVKKEKETETKTNINKNIANHVFGNVPIMERLEDFGIAQSGFGICSLQFGLHYFCKNTNDIHQLMRNVSECTKVHGYFIGTCFDGKVLFDKLQYTNNICITNKKNKKKMLEIIKLYTHTTFPQSTPCTGYSISVWQESIQKHTIEYLVNFDYLQRIAENYGFVTLSAQEGIECSIYQSSASFHTLYTQLQKEPLSRMNQYGQALYMTQEEKDISFLNRYFIFKKIHHINDTSNVQNTMGE